MISSVCEQNKKSHSKIGGFLSGIGSIISLSPSVPNTAYKGQGQDTLMLAKDMQRIGGDFKIAVKRIVADDGDN